MEISRPRLLKMGAIMGKIVKVRLSREKVRLSTLSRNLNKDNLTFLNLYVYEVFDHLTLRVKVRLSRRNPYAREGSP